MRIELRVKLLLLCGISRFASGAALCARNGFRNYISRFGLYVLRKIMFFISNNAIREPDTGSEAVMKHLSHQVDEVLLQIFVHECTGHLHENHP